MERCHRDPVEASGEPSGMEQRALGDDTAVGGRIRGDGPLQPGLTGKSHLRSEAQQAGRVERLDPPEIEGIADPQFVGMPTTPAHADSTHESVEHTTCRPEEIAGEPAALASDPADRREHGVRRPWGVGGLHIGEHRATRPLRIGREGVGRAPAAQFGIGPRGLDPQVTHPTQCHVHRVPVGEGLAGYDGIDGVIAHDDLVHETVDEGSGEIGGERCHQPDPARGQ